MGLAELASSVPELGVCAAEGSQEAEGNPATVLPGRKQDNTRNQPGLLCIASCRVMAHAGTVGALYVCTSS